MNETAQHTDMPICSEVTSSCTFAPHLPTEIPEQPLRGCSIEDKFRTSTCDALEDERPNLKALADTPYCPPVDDRTTSLLCHENAGEMPKRSQRVAIPRFSSVSNAPSIDVITAPREAPFPSGTSTDTQASRTAEVDARSTSVHNSESLLLACVLASALQPSATTSTEPISPVSPAKHLSELARSFSLPDSSIYGEPSASQNALAAASRKRKRRDNNAFSLGSQQDSPLYSIAAKISNAILLGGRKYKPSIFETWERDLWLLNPDRAQLTLTGLLTKQRADTEALLCQGIVARIIHSWCLIAYEYRLSTAGRSESIRRDQKEIRLSLRCRKLGILFVEIINRLFARPDIGIDAYKVCPAIAGECIHWYIPAID
jgi:hypothetical protein